MEFEDQLTRSEHNELIRLMSYKALLNTSREDWHKTPNEFVSIALPDNIIKFSKIFKEPNIAISNLIANLIERGITTIAKEVKDTNVLDQMIKDITHPEGVSVQ